MRLACPHCGERGNDEFVYLGDASVARPDPNSAHADDAFYRYGYERANAAGPHRELWYHAAGCHAWLVVTRNTVTHDVLKVEIARDVAQARTKSLAADAR